ncbi:MAG: sulfatase-like hydrolase/transferase [Deltaproteobacteria bacterium]|nr:sulfatase-like hydrolase/transferase [Deltaproteobacteria bacterium]MBW2361794.1 sulfatase-like hydrolase/transferase [Deltaproteobacteria bacterium]
MFERVRAAAWTAICVTLCAGCGVREVERPPQARHAVLVSVDALAARHVGAYGHSADTTPHLDALAAEGALFASAYTQQLWTLTSHLTMMTGLTPQVLGAGHERPAREDLVTLAQHLKRAGFTTAAYVGAQGYMNARFGLGRGFETYVTRSANKPLDNRAAFKWLRVQARRARSDPEHRFFLFLHYYDVHSDAGTQVPYDSPYRQRFMPEGVQWQHPGDTAVLGRLRRSGEVDDEDRQALHALYDGGIFFVDKRAIGPIVELLEEEGLAEETLLAVTSDHGDELFEHGNISHQQPYDEGARVPLVMRGPGVPAGLRVEALAGLVDLMPSMLSLLGFSPPANIQGRDLAPLLRGGPPVRDAVFVDGIMAGYRHYRSAAVVDTAVGRYAWIGRVEAPPGESPRRFRHEPPAELYELRTDPGQTRDLAAERPDLAAVLERRILDWYAESEARLAGLGTVEREKILSDEDHERLRALGYSE